MLEWFVPGTVPGRDDDWQHQGRTMLPAEYAEWLAQESSARGSSADRASVGPAADTWPAVGGLRIVSPQDGDRYQVPPGVDARFATIALRAVGGRGPGGLGGAGGAVRWYVDGRAATGVRLALVRGAHVIRVAGRWGESDEVRIVVE
jgi:hypothetical protein